MEFQGQEKQIGFDLLIGSWMFRLMISLAIMKRYGESNWAKIRKSFRGMIFGDEGQKIGIQAL